MATDGDHLYEVDNQDAKDTNKLEQMATSLAGMTVIIDSQEVQGTNFEQVDRTVRVILIRRASAEGAVRVFGNEVWNIVTGPKERGFVLLSVKDGETCRLLGTPSVRYFRAAS